MRDFQRDYAGGRTSSSWNRTTVRTARSSMRPTRSFSTTRIDWAKPVDRRGAGELIRVYAATSDNDEAEFILDEVKALNRRARR